MGKRLTERACSATICNRGGPTKRSAARPMNCSASARKSRTSNAEVRVAILYSNDSHYGIEFMKFNDRVNYRSILQQMYGALYRANVGGDFVFPESTNFANYRVIVVPPFVGKRCAAEGLGRLRSRRRQLDCPTSQRDEAMAREVAQKGSVLTQRPTTNQGYCNFAYSALACLRMGMSGSASFQSVKKS
jgi:Beta-galactosidase trimerisation domain